MTFDIKAHILSGNQPDTKMAKFNRQDFKRFRNFVEEMTDSKNTQNRFHILKMYLKETRSYQLSKILEKIWQRAERKQNPLLKQVYVRILGITGGLRKDTPETIKGEILSIAASLSIDLEPNRERQSDVDEIIRLVLPEGPPSIYTAGVRREIAEEESQKLSVA